MSGHSTCTVCRGRNISLSVSVEEVPVLCSALCPTRTSALELPRASIALGFCHDCGHLFNGNYDAETLRYGSSYDSSLHFSGTFQKYIETLADSLVERYELRGKTVVEIGCGWGDFLRLLCSRGVGRGVGFDPSYPAGVAVEEAGSAMSIRRELFPGAEYSLADGDFVCCRHTLEHIGVPRAFVSALRTAMGSLKIPVFFEVPNSLYTLRDGGIWDVIYEHCSYFSPASLTRIFWECDFEPVQVEETYGRQFLTIHATAGRTSETPPVSDDPAMEQLVSSFQRKYENKLNFWQREITTLETNGRKLVVWGAGAKAATFLNLVRPRSLEYVVDINPRKQGNFVPGSGQLILSPEFLVGYRPDIVIITNAYYSAEVRKRLYDLGLEPELLVT
jgi:C-methyltransferase C-terminal domain/Methyltransferase domain